MIKIDICFTFILLYFLFVISLEDYKTMLISEVKLILMTLTGLFYLTLLGFSNDKINGFDLILKNSLSMVIVYITMYLISYLSLKIFETNSLGLGDIKLSSISTLWLGIELSFLSLSISFLLSAIYSLHGKITRRLKPFQPYPFAPFLSIGIFLFWLIDKIEPI